MIVVTGSLTIKRPEDAEWVTFSTGSKELMIVVTGSLTIKRPEDDEWVTFFEGESFNVPAGVSFEVKVEGPTAYICRYS